MISLFRGLVAICLLWGESRFTAMKLKSLLLKRGFWRVFWNQNHNPVWSDNFFNNQIRKGCENLNALFRLNQFSQNFKNVNKYQYQSDRIVRYLLECHFHFEIYLSKWWRIVDVIEEIMGLKNNGLQVIQNGAHRKLESWLRSSFSKV